MENFFEKSEKSMIFLDIDALPTKDYAADIYELQSVVSEYIKNLSHDNRNIVVLFSSQTQESMEKEFSIFPKVWLVAEHGYMYRPGHKGTEWRRLCTNVDRYWMNAVIEFLAVYEENVDGSKLEVLESIIVFNVKNVDEEQAQVIIKDLIPQLKTLLSNDQVDVVEGFKQIQIKP